MLGKVFWFAVFFSLEKKKFGKRMNEKIPPLCDSIIFVKFSLSQIENALKGT